MKKERNLEGLPLKYFNVPPGNDIDLEAHAILMDQIEAISGMLNNVFGSSEVCFDELLLNHLSDIMESLLFQARAIMEAGEK